MGRRRILYRYVVVYIPYNEEGTESEEYGEPEEDLIPKSATHTNTHTTHRVRVQDM